MIVFLLLREYLVWKRNWECSDVATLAGIEFIVLELPIIAFGIAYLRWLL